MFSFSTYGISKSHFGKKKKKKRRRTIEHGSLLASRHRCSILHLKATLNYNVYNFFVCYSSIWNVYLAVTFLYIFDIRIASLKTPMPMFTFFLRENIVFCCMRHRQSSLYQKLANICAEGQHLTFKTDKWAGSFLDGAKKLNSYVKQMFISIPHL